MPETTTPSISELVDQFLRAQRATNVSEIVGMSFTKSIQAFISVSDWLAPEHMPAVYTLTALAEQLDSSPNVSAALIAQFGVTFRDLRSQAPSSSYTDDPIEQALRARANGDAQ